MHSCRRIWFSSRLHGAKSPEINVALVHTELEGMPGGYACVEALEIRSVAMLSDVSTSCTISSVIEPAKCLPINHSCNFGCFPPHGRHLGLTATHHTASKGPAKDIFVPHTHRWLLNVVLSCPFKCCVQEVNSVTDTHRPDFTVARPANTRRD